MPSIPFTLPDINFGLTEIKGVVYLEEEFLVFEVETAILGEFDQEQQIIKIETAALKDIRLERGWFQDRLYIRPKKRDLLEIMPGTYGSELPLQIWRKYRRDTAQLVESTQRGRRRLRPL